MAATSWTPSASVDDVAPFALAADASEYVPEDAFEGVRKLFNEEVFRVEFFQAVRLLQRIEKNRGAVGYFLSPLRMRRFASSRCRRYRFHPASFTT